jgi:hypothetical protein
MTTLLNLSAEAAQLQALLDAWADDHDGVVDDLPADITKALEDSAESMAVKVDRIVSVIRDFRAKAAARNAEARALAASARAEDAKADSLQEYIGHCLRTAGARKWSGTIHEVAVCANGGKRPLEVKLHPSDLPMAYQRITLDADTDAIRAALDRGEAITGCSYGERGTHIRVK